MTITQLLSGPKTLLMQAELPFTSPFITFSYWTQPALLQQWWPEQAEVQPRTGGLYHLSWPQMDWHLRGHYLVFEPPNRLAFSWRWDHDPPEEATREVRLTFESLASQGTRLLLTHGPYQDTPSDQQVRLEQHLDGLASK